MPINNVDIMKIIDKRERCDARYIVMILSNSEA